MDKNKEEKLILGGTITKMISGDQEAFEEILYVYEKPIFNHLIRLTGSRDDAADLLQETFIRVYDKRSQIDPRGNFKNWLYRIATNLAYDYFRRKKRENLVSIDDENLSETIEAELSYTSLGQEIAVIDLENALIGINPHYKNILLLYYKEGFRYEEIAKILNSPLNTVKTHLRRARQELAKLLKNTYG
jgi:RNA polymerase sigma-70 factor (ECF subfamily)